MNQAERQEPTTDPVEPDVPSPGRSVRKPSVAALGLAVAGACLVLSTGCGGEAGQQVAPGPYTGAEKVEVTDLSDLPEEVGHNVYWAGKRGGAPVGVSTDRSGNVHLRYLPGRAAADDPDPVFFDVGSYPFPGAYKATADLVGQPGNVRVEVPGGVAFYPRSRPTSVILAFRDDPDVQVEVFHPDPKKALYFAKSGVIVPVS